MCRSTMRPCWRLRTSPPPTTRTSRPRACWRQRSDGDTITKYQFWDSTSDPSSGHFVVGGVAQGTNQHRCDGSAAVQHHVPERLGFGRSVGLGPMTERCGASGRIPRQCADQSSARGDGSGLTATHDQNIAALQPVQVSEPMAMPSRTTSSGIRPPIPPAAILWWAVSPKAPTSNIDVTAAQLSSTTFQSGRVRTICGSVPMTDRVGRLEGIPRQRAAQPRAGVITRISPPPITRTSQPPACSAKSDADGDTITKFQFWDSTAGPSSGHWVVGGVAQGANVTIDVTASQLSAPRSRAARVRMILWVRANDGAEWGAWKEFHVNAPLNRRRS